MRDAKFVSVEFFPSKQKLTIRADEEGPVRLTKYPEGGGYISLTGLQKEVGWETAGTADVCYTRDGNEVSLDLSPLFPDSSEVPTNKVGGPDRK
jgi:hypothetical protein